MNDGYRAALVRVPPIGLKLVTGFIRDDKRNVLVAFLGCPARDFDIGPIVRGQIAEDVNVSFELFNKSSYFSSVDVARSGDGQ